MSASYSIHLLAPNRSGRAGELRGVIENRLLELGLAVGDVEFTLNGEGVGDEFCSRVAAYFGGPRQSEAATQIVSKLVHAGQLVVPFMENLADYHQKVPFVLHKVNGEVDNGSDHALERVSNRLLQGLGLVRSKRRVFISYRRKEAQGVANQLAVRLHRAGYTVFLDTISVRSGQLFQEDLWHAMADTDLLILLDTPGAKLSTWVGKELVRAIRQGTTIFDIVWPGHTRDGSLELSEVSYLNLDDFLKHAPATRASGRLREPVLDKIVCVVERLRARAFGARRESLVGEFVERVNRIAGISAVSQPDGRVRVIAVGNEVGVLPIIGAPASTHYYETLGADLGSEANRLLYRGEGLHAEYKLHLDWLDAYLPVKGLALSAVSKWLEGLL